ncbi:Rrf2 family transcriptional regulator [Streptomyces sp. NPDC091376]|uniref:Rrf2 family transcriptional regulator n=1 Tax=Streptomyces sp. NPDC091376 TaxID=3365994 RepID=UPI00382C4065
MSANSKLTVATHVLVWMELSRRLGRDLVTSEQIAESVNTNPVVIRRCLGELRKAGFVDAKRGSGAGWFLLVEPDAVTLEDVFRAVDPGPVLGLHHTQPNQECPVGSGIRPTLQRVYDDLEDTMRRRLARTTLADVLKDILAQQDGRDPSALVNAATHTD